MRKRWYILCLLAAFCFVLSACQSQTEDAVERLIRAVHLLKGDAAPDTSQTELADLGEYAFMFDGSPLTLDKMKRIARLAGYELGDGYSGIDAKDVKEGFTVSIPWEGQIWQFPIVECKNERAAEQNAARIDAEGKLVALQYKQFLSVCSEEEDGNDLGEMLALILVGDPVFLDTMELYDMPSDKDVSVQVNDGPISPLDGFIEQRKAGEEK